MASKQSYPCFACRKAGHEVQVFLDGNDDQGHTKCLNEDGARHTHLGSSASVSSSRNEGSKTVTTQVTSNKEDPVMKLLNDPDEPRYQIIRRKMKGCDLNKLPSYRPLFIDKMPLTLTQQLK